jgi:hypothetical protein
MIHDSTWLARTCAAHRMRLTASIGLLLACMLLVALPAMASASTPEMRGEWELLIKAPGEAPAKGIALISVEANGSGEFATDNFLVEHVIHGTFSGTLEGAKASVEVTTEAYGPLPAAKFTSTTMTVEPNGATPSISGSGELVSGKEPPVTGTIVATRIKTYREVEEREEREAKEKQAREEQEARENIRGEWSLVVKVGPETSNGTALIKTAANAENKFASSGVLFESIVPGSFSGTLEGSTATVTVTSEAYGPAPANEFTGEKITVTSTGNSLSISGTGKLYSNKALVTENATLVATRIKTYAEVVAREAKEKLEREAKEKEAKEKLELEAKEQEAKAKAEQEAKAKAEQEAKAKAELEAKAKAEQEAKAKAEQEAKAKAEQEAKKKATISQATLVSVQLVGKTFTVSTAGLLSLQVSNPNAYAISGRITLVMGQSAKAGKTSSAHGSASKKAESLGTVSFGISPNGKQLVKLELSQGGRAELAHHKTLSVLATVLTKASGQATTTKTLTLTLHAGKAAHGKG